MPQRNAIEEVHFLDENDPIHVHMNFVLPALVIIQVLIGATIQSVSLSTLAFVHRKIFYQMLVSI